MIEKSIPDLDFPPEEPIPELELPKEKPVSELELPPLPGPKLEEGVGVLEERALAGLAVTFRFTHAFFRQTLYEEMFTPRRIDQAGAGRYVAQQSAGPYSVWAVHNGRAKDGDGQAMTLLMGPDKFFSFDFGAAVRVAVTAEV